MHRKAASEERGVNEPRYIQTDLEIRADFDLRRLVKSFGDAVYKLACGHPEVGPLTFAGLELSDYSPSLNKTLRNFCKIIEALPERGRTLWDKASSRVFDIGFESGDDRPVMPITIDPKLFVRIAALGATVAVTIYPLSRRQDEGRTRNKRSWRPVNSHCRTRVRLLRFAQMPRVAHLRFSRRSNHLTFPARAAHTYYI
jgi:hypothetical protein